MQLSDCGGRTAYNTVCLGQAGNNEGHKRNTVLHILIPWDCDGGEHI